jgi:hypothetical protein
MLDAGDERVEKMGATKRTLPVGSASSAQCSRLSLPVSGHLAIGTYERYLASLTGSDSQTDSR